MTPLYRDPWFTFRFADDRLIPRFHLDGATEGSRVGVYRLDNENTRGPLLGHAMVGSGGWVDLEEAIVMRAGEAFIAVPETHVLVREETEIDADAVRIVNERAFGQDGEARLVAALRAGGYARVSLVAEVDGAVVGHILFSDLAIHTPYGIVAALALAPMAVLPEHQRNGIGTALVRRGLEMCRDRGHRIVVVLGHADYYPRFGFSPALAKPLESPYAGDHFMALELVPGALAGVAGRVEYAPPFNDV